MQPVTVKTAARSDENTVVSTLVTAFSADPAARWTYPDPQQYLAYFPCFVQIFGGKAFQYDTAYTTEGCAAALWLPPGVHPEEEALMALLRSTVPNRVQPDLFAVFEQMGRFHPDEPHWYLPLIGVDLPRQGRGYGTALMQHALAACDRDGLPAYLESTHPKNIPLYQRHGFEVVGTIQAGMSPPIYPMVRKPQ